MNFPDEPGFQPEPVKPKNEERNNLLERIKSSLDDNRPIIAVIPGHALTLIGYSNASKKLIAWDQRMDKPRSPFYLPAGGFEVPEWTIQTRFSDLIFVRRSWVNASQLEAETINSLRPETKKIRHHEIVNANTKDESLREFLNHATEPKIEAILNSGRIPLILSGNKKLAEVTEKSDTKWRIKWWPSQESEEVGKAVIARLVEKNEGVMFSCEKLPGKEDFIVTDP